MSISPSPAPASEPSTNNEFLLACENATALACYDTTTSGENILSSLYVNLIIGMLCLLGFVVWRGTFAIYFTKLVLPDLSPRPPEMDLRGHRRLWSWLVPVLTIDNDEFLRLAGFDAFVAVKILTFGVTLFIPITVIGVGVLLPVNYTYTDIGDDASSVFYRMTISNISNKASILWLHFCVFVIFVAWTCFLLLRYYNEHTALRQTMLDATAREEIRSFSASGNIPVGTECPPGEDACLKIWPVRRLEDERRLVPRPGKYTVIIRDEMIQEFNTSSVKPLGAHHYAVRRRRSGSDVEQIMNDSGNAYSTKQIRMRTVEETFRALYGDDFEGIVPVCRSKPVNKLLDKYELVLMKIDRIELALSEAKTEKKQAALGKKLAALKELAVSLGRKTMECQQELKNEEAQPCFIALFRSQEAASWAATSNPNPVHKRLLHVVPGVDPENVNWPTLERGWKQRAIRPVIVTIIIVLIMLFPIGLFTGAFAQLSIALCGDSSPDAKGSASGTWFCSDDFWAKLFRNLLTGWLPSICLSVYQSVFLPVAFYCCAQAESWHVSLSGMDLRIASLFFYWDIFNFFLGAMLGGSLASGIRAAINDPGQLPEIIGGAASAASNFFINYVIQRALMMTFFRLFWPNASMTMYLFRFFRIFPKPKTKRDIEAENPPRNIRYGRDIGVTIMTVYICVFGYCVVSPFILPVALLYFLIITAVWRYQLLYVYVAAYNSDGQMWPYFAHRVVACLGLCSIFTGCIFLVKQAYVQGGLCIFLIGTALIVFNKYLSDSYDAVFVDIPAAILRKAPRVRISRDMYVPPGLRPGAKGYYFESGKAWQGWGAPRHGY